jgi:3-oxo-5-alpha-steroid 4-dehydrogenase 1
MLFTLSVLVIFAAAPLVFALLFFFRAPYGRHFHGGWGPTVSARAGWFLMELPALVVIAVCVVLAGREVSLLSFLLLGLWEIHYLYRTCLFPFLIRDRGKQFPIAVIAFAGVFNSLNGYANGMSLAASPTLPDPGLLSGVRLVVGIAMFAAGFVTHVWTDRNLRSLRRPGEIGYKIPRGGLFDLVASPNYFGEITQWTGWALATWSLPGLAFAVFTVANLVPRARAHRQWYIETFPEYPRERKRVIPFVY